VVLDAAAGRADIKAVKEFVRNGGSLVLRKLTPESLEEYSDMLPAGMSLEEMKDTWKIIKAENGKAVNGLRNYDMHWGSGHIGQETSQKKAGDILHFAVSTDSLKGAAGVTVYTEPAGLMEVKYGVGRILVDQVLWDEGWKTPVKSKCELIASNIFTNLGAVMDPGAGKDTVLPDRIRQR